MLPGRAAARIRLVVTALLFSTGGAAIKATSLNAWQVASLRSGVAAVAVWLLVPAARRRWNWRILLVAVSFAATMVLFVAANKLTTSANAIFLQSTAPLWVLLVGPFVLHERASRHDLVFMGVVAVGMAMFFVGTDRPQATAPDPARGNVFAMLSGIGYAGVVLGLRWVGRAHEPLSATADEAATEVSEVRDGDAITTVVAGNVVACVVALPLALPAPSIHTSDALVILYLGAVQIGLAYLLMSTAMPHVPALEASTILLVEPALNPVWSWVVHGERPSPLSLAGGAFIILAAAFKSWWDARRIAATADAAVADTAPATVHARRG
jgi:drug/metabolite transporter (DMT)-like permease